MKKRVKEWIAECASAIYRLPMPKASIAFKDVKKYTRKAKHKKPIIND